MANKNLFQTLKGKLIPKADAINEEFAPAYGFAPEHALAQYASTGCMNRTFYATAEEQMETVLNLCEKVDPEFLARVAVYTREKGYMKDLPAMLCAVLSTKSPSLLKAVFPRVIDNGKMLRNFVQILRSGVVGRKSLGTAPKQLVLSWLDERKDQTIFEASVGQDPSLADVIKMVHPKPKTSERAALYGYLIGKKYNFDLLPAVVQQFERFKQGQKEVVPDIPFQMLTALDLGKKEWTEIARHASWQMLRMNLNTLARHEVFNVAGMATFVANKIADPELVRKARAFPYQLLMAYKSAENGVPAKVREALQDAMEAAIRNVPAIEGKIYVCPDVSGSMRHAVTGHRKGSTSAVRCVDVAALVAAAIVRKNPTAEVLPFEQNVVPVALNPRDSVMTNASKLASVGGGGTNCSAPLALLNKQKAIGDLVVLVSDNESWVDASGGRGTATMREWSAFLKLNPNARLVCVDIQPYRTTQAAERGDVLNIGGFSDQVFNVIAEFANGKLTPDHWIGVIKSVEL